MPGKFPKPHHPVRNPAPSTPRRSGSSAIKTDWNDAATWYDDLVGDTGSEYHREVVLPGVTRLLALESGDRAIDVACGQGVLCRMLAERGIEMTGVDASSALIDAALARGPKNIRYQVQDATQLGGLPPEHYSAAACVLAIANMNPLGSILAGIAKLLKPGGRLVLVMMHPCFRSPKESAWGWDQVKGVQFRRVDRYLLPRKTPIATHPGSAPDEYTWTFHRPIEAYAKALRNSGLLIDAIEEWPSHKTSTSGPRASAENSSRKEIPMFLAIRALKVGLPQPA